MEIVKFRDRIEYRILHHVLFLCRAYILCVVHGPDLVSNVDVTYYSISSRTVGCMTMVNFLGIMGNLV